MEALGRIEKFNFGRVKLTFLAYYQVLQNTNILGKPGLFLGIVANPAEHFWIFKILYLTAWNNISTNFLFLQFLTFMQKKIVLTKCMTFANIWESSLSVGCSRGSIGERQNPEREKELLYKCLKFSVANIILYFLSFLLKIFNWICRLPLKILRERGEDPKMSTLSL